MAHINKSGRVAAGRRLNIYGWEAAYESESAAQEPDILDTASAGNIRHGVGLCRADSLGYDDMGRGMGGAERSVHQSLLPVSDGVQYLGGAQRPDNRGDNGQRAGEKL